jgi:hypothetical protein
MTTCVGDPLYRPFKGAVELEERPATGEWADYRQNARLWFSTDRAAGDAALRAAAKKNRSGVTMEGLGLLQISVNDRDAALASFSEARELYGRSEDAMRVAIHEIIQLRAGGRASDARALALKMIALAPNSPSVPLLRGLSESAPVTPAPSAQR